MSFEDYVDEDLYQPSQAEIGDTRPIIQNTSRDEKEFLTNLMAGALMAGHKEAKSIPGIRPTREVTVSDDEIIEQADKWLRQIGLTYDGLTSLMTQSDAQEGHDWAWELTRKPEAQWNAASILKTANPFNTAMDVITGKPGATQESIRQHGANPYSDGTDYMGGAFAGLDALDIASLWPMYKGPMWVLKNLMARMAPSKIVRNRSNDLSPLLTAKDLRPKGMHSSIQGWPPYDEYDPRPYSERSAEWKSTFSEEQLRQMEEEGVARAEMQAESFREPFDDDWDEALEYKAREQSDVMYENFNPANQEPTVRLTDKQSTNITGSWERVNIEGDTFVDPFKPIDGFPESYKMDHEWYSLQYPDTLLSAHEYIPGVGFVMQTNNPNVMGPVYPWTRPLPDQIDINNLQSTVFDVLDEFNVQYNQGALGQVLEEGGVEGFVESLLKQPHIEMMFPGKLRDILKLSDKEYSPFIKWLAAASLVAAPLGIKDVASQRRGPNQQDKSGTVFEGIDEAPMLETMIYDAAQQNKRMSIVMGRTSQEMLQPVWDSLVSDYGIDYAKEIMDPPDEMNPLVTGNAIHLAYLDDDTMEWVARNGPRYGFYQNPDRPWEITFGEKARPKTGDLGDILSVTLNTQQPVIQEPIEFQDSFKVLQNRGQLSSSERAIWANQFLQRIDAPITADNLDTVVTWIHNENGADFNPINTTWGKSHDEWPVINDHGVKAYPDWNTGLRASVETIKESQYSEMLEALQRGTTPQEFEGLLMPTPWGTNHFHTHPDTYDYVELFNE